MWLQRLECIMTLELQPIKKFIVFYLQPLCAAETNKEMEQKSAEICSTFIYSSVFTTVVKSKVTSHELNHLKQAFGLCDPGFEP